MFKKHFILLTIGLFFLILKSYAQDTTLINSWYKEDIHREIRIIKAKERYGIVNDTGGVILPIVYNAIEFLAPEDSS